MLARSLEHTRDCIHLLHLDGTLRWSNAAAASHFRRNGSPAAAGDPWLDFWTKPRDREAAASALASALESGHARFEGFCPGANGEPAWWDVSLTLIKGQDGNPAELLVAARNITQNVCAQSAVEKKAAQLEMIVDRVPALVAYVNASGIYEWVNCSYLKWYGLPATEVVGRRWHEVLGSRLGEDYVEQLRPKVEAALQGESVTFEASHHFGGERHDLLLSYVPDVKQGEPVRGFVLLVTDVTQQRRHHEELVASQQRFRTLTETLPSVIWTATPDGRIDYMSDRFREVTGCDPESAFGEQWAQVIHPEDLPTLSGRWAESLQQESRLEVLYRVRQRDGSFRWFLGRSLPQRNEAGEVIRWVGVSTDVHHHIAAEEKIRLSERRYRLLFDDNPLPMWTYDRDTLRFRSVNDAAVRMYGYSREEFLSMSVTRIRPEEDLPMVLPLLRQSHFGKPVQVRHKRKDGTVFWVEVIGHEVAEGNVPIQLVVAQDITERIRLNEELLRRAHHDPLTGLPNRRLLGDRFEQMRARADRNRHKIALLVIDFDRFKDINDTFGHEVGDEFLKAASERIRSRMRSSDTLARMGGDEFIAVADDVHNLEEGMEVVRHLFAAVTEPVAVNELQLQPMFSVGLAVYPDDGANLEDLIRHADYGLYQAKRSGRNCWRHFQDDEVRGVEDARRIERSLRSALDDGRLTLHYQPVFSPDGTVKLFEGLLRLSDPKAGMVPPAVFIPIAEESGLIHSIGLWVLREACRQVKAWQDSGLVPVPIAVNVSARQFARGNLAAEVRRGLEEFGIHPELLELELTESLLMENTELSRQQLATLKEIGVRIAMDDFGTGYSSLSYLHSLPIDTLKIDRTFVQKIDASRSDPIVAAIVDLGQKLGLRVVAEGVETEAQRLELTRLGCDLLQGFLLARPAAPEAVERFLAHTQASTHATAAY